MKRRRKLAVGGASPSRGPERKAAPAVVDALARSRALSPSLFGFELLARFLVVERR